MHPLVDTQVNLHGLISSIDTSTVVHCGTLNNPVDGSVMIMDDRVFGSSVEYRCNTGFLLIGNIMRTCQSNSQWSGSEPTCTREFKL